MRGKCDFSGYATKNDLKCSDGRVIKRDAFRDNDGTRVPLVWQHGHNDPANVLGHALLENRSDGVYAYCTFNNSEAAMNAKELVRHGDINTMSIHANRLVQKGSDVIHGQIREVSLVLAGANPGALIDNVNIIHGDGDFEVDYEEAIITTGLELVHGDGFGDIYHEEDDMGRGRTVGEVYDSMTDEQKNVVAFLLDQQSSDDYDDDYDDDHDDYDDEDSVDHADYDGGYYGMRNVFDTSRGGAEDVLTHSEIKEIFKDAEDLGSLKEAALEHGITNLEILFPEAKNIRQTPDFIKRDTEWVGKVWGGFHKSPFSRIKSIAADITAEEARAKGYIKGKKKLEEVFKLLKRVTGPQTVYKKQKLDRDDIIDITDFDVVAWMKMEMRMMLEEELARAALIGDGRSSGADDKIKPEHIRPIYGDDELYTIYSEVPIEPSDKETEKTKKIIKAALLARINYKGAGMPSLYCSPMTLTSMLLAEDGMGHRLYKTEAELASALRVKEIVEIPVLEGARREDDSHNFELLGIIANLSDYTVGADKGGAVSMFDDFDIDYNQYKYLIETRCSGTLTKPYSAIALEVKKN